MSGTGRFSQTASLAQLEKLLSGAHLRRTLSDKSDIFGRVGRGRTESDGERVFSRPALQVVFLAQIENLLSRGRLRVSDAGGEKGEA